MRKKLTKRITINKELGDSVVIALTEDHMFNGQGVLSPRRFIRELYADENGELQSKPGEAYEYAIDYFGERRDDWGLIEMTWDTVVGHTLREVLDKYNEKTRRPISHVRGFEDGRRQN